MACLGERDPHLRLGIRSQSQWGMRLKKFEKRVSGSESVTCNKDASGTGRPRVISGTLGEGAEEGILFALGERGTRGSFVHEGGGPAEPNQMGRRKNRSRGGADGAVQKE